jgi:polyisoprenoid-binding protein YceI
MKVIIFILATIINISGEANVKLVKSEIKFSATGRPSFIKANGSVPLIETNLEFGANEISGSAKVDLNKLDSGIKLRDEHLKEKYLHTNKFPEAMIVINKTKVNFGKRNKLKAVLSFHGKKKEITLDTELEKNGKIVTLNSEFEFLLTDFDVELPSFQGITAADKVKLYVVASFEL